MRILRILDVFGLVSGNAHAVLPTEVVPIGEIVVGRGLGFRRDAAVASETEKGDLRFNEIPRPQPPVSVVTGDADGSACENQISWRAYDCALGGADQMFDRIRRALG